MEKPAKYITKRCHAPGCRNKANVVEGLSLHRYPNKEKDPERYKKWLDAFKLNKAPLKSHYICSAHFLITDFYPIRNESQTKLMLGETAVPSVNLFIRKVYSSGIKQLQQDMMKRKLEKYTAADLTIYLDGMADDGGDPFSIGNTVELQEEDTNSIFIEPLPTNSSESSLKNQMTLLNHRSTQSTITDHISTIHPDLMPKTQKSEHATQLLELYECLLDGSWLDDCFSCQEQLKQFVEHVQKIHKEPQGMETSDFDHYLSEKEDAMVDSEVINDDHDYFETTKVVEKPTKSETQEISGTAINSYLSNTSDKVYFKVGRADNGTSLYTCTVCSCTFELYNDILEHYKVHADTKVFDEIIPPVMYDSTLHTGRGKLLPSDFQCGLCEDLHRTRELVLKCLEAHKRLDTPTETEHSEPSTNESSLNCHICQREFRNDQSVSDHMTLVHGKTIEILRVSDVRIRRTFTCELCSICFQNVQAAALHRREQHLIRCSEQTLSGVRVIINADGSEVYDTKRNFAYFARKSAFKYWYQCICNQSFQKEDQAEICLAKHVGIKKLVCGLDGCGRRYCVRSELERHQKRMHKTIPKGLTTICELCGKIVGQSGIRGHMQWHRNGGAEGTRARKLQHQSRQPVKCDVCNKVYKGQFQLRKHVSIIHKREKRFSCPVCNKFYFYYQSADLCEAKHGGVKSVECDLCEKLFYTRSQMANHRLQTHLKTENV